MPLTILYSLIGSISGLIKKLKLPPVFLVMFFVILNDRRE
jgi:hypothetical protein